MVDMVLKDDDYLMNITVQVAVQRKKAAAVIALGVQRKNPQSEPDKVGSAVVDIMSQELSKHYKLIDVGLFSAKRIASVREYYETGLTPEEKHQVED